MKIICPPIYDHNGFVTIHALGHMIMYGISCAQVHELSQSHGDDSQRAHCFHDCIYIYIYICIYLIYIYIYIYIQDIYNCI